MRPILAGFVSIVVLLAASAPARALVFPLTPGDSISVFGTFLCTKTLPCEGGNLYEFTVNEPVDLQANLTLDNYSGVSMTLFPAATPGAPLQTWSASSPGAVTVVTLAYAGLLPGTIYNVSIFGSVPLIPGTIQTGGFEGRLGVAAAPLAPVSAVPLPGAFWLFGSGLLTLLLAFARRR